MLRDTGEERLKEGVVIKKEAAKVKERLEGARNIAVLTGAGVSAESGVPTFRGEGGLWKNFRAEELATPEAFKKDPALVWEFYDFRRQTLSRIRPNPAHYALARLSERFENFTVITQNVDGLHTLAGSKTVLELHGNIWRVRCLECGGVSENRVVPINTPPRCNCGGLLRPDVVWFGEALPEETFQKALRAAEKCEIMLVVGTSGVVQPAMSLAVAAKSNGAFLVEINPDPGLLSHIMDVVIPAGAGKTLPELL